MNHLHLPTTLEQEHFDDEQSIPEWLDPVLYDEVLSAIENRSTFFGIGYTRENMFWERLVLDRRSVEYIVQFLRRNEHITQLHLECNLEEDAAVLLIQFLRDTPHIRMIFVYGDHVQWDDNDDEGSDDGSLLQCLSFALQKNTSVVHLRLSYFNFQDATNRSLVQDILYYRRPMLIALEFLFCLFGDHAEFLTDPLLTHGGGDALKFLVMHACRTINHTVLTLGIRKILLNCPVLQRLDLILQSNLISKWEIQQSLVNLISATLFALNTSLLEVNVGYSNVLLDNLQLMEDLLCRNKMMVQVHKSLEDGTFHTCCGLWAKALAVLAAKDASTGLTPMYQTLSFLAPKLFSKSSSSE